MISRSYQTNLSYLGFGIGFDRKNDDNCLVVEVVGCVVFCGCLPFTKKTSKLPRKILRDQLFNIAGWKMDPDWRCIILFKNGGMFHLVTMLRNPTRGCFIWDIIGSTHGTSTEVLYGEAKRSWHDPLGYWHANETIHLLRRSCAIDCVGHLPWLRPGRKHVGV